MGLTAAELDRMRTDAEALMPNTLTRLTKTTVPDGQGGWTTSWGTAGTAIPCRLSVLSVRERSAVVGDKYTVYDVYRLAIHWDQTLAGGDRVVIASDTYDVLNVIDDHDWRVARRALIMKQGT